MFSGIAPPSTSLTLTCISESNKLCVGCKTFVLRYAILLKVLFPYPLNSLMAHQVWCGLLSRRKQRQQVHTDVGERMRAFHSEAGLWKGLCSGELGNRSGGQILRERQLLWLVACNGQVEGKRRVVCRMGLEGALVLCGQELRWAVQGVCQAK